MTFKQKIADRFGFVPRQELHKARKRSFEAVQVSRLTKEFIEMNTSINADIRAGGSRLRNLSRQTYENSSHARRWVDLYVTNVVGASGHILQSDIKMLEEDAETKSVMEVSDDEKNNLLEKHFEEWGKGRNCSVTKIHSYATMQKMWARHKARDGECFIRRVVDPGAKYGLRLQTIPPEMVPETYTIDLNNGNVVVCGIEFNPWREPVAYYVSKNNKVKNDLWAVGGTNTQDLERVSASEMIHWFDPDFSNQSRGYTRMANVILMLNWLKDYNYASVLNAKFSARKLGFLTDANPEDPAEAITSDTNDQHTTEAIGGREETDSRPSISGEELTFTDIGNKKLEKWDPTYPHDQHVPFNQVSLRDIATGLNVAYCSLSGDYSNSTWSSARTELDVERNNWTHEQQLMISVVDMTIYGWWLELALQIGAIPGFSYKDFGRLNKPFFYGPTWEYINPVDESAALRSDAEAQFISPYDIAAKKGRRLEDIYRDIQGAARLRKKFKLPDPVYGKGAPATIDANAPMTVPSKNGKTNGVNA